MAIDHLLRRTFLRGAGASLLFAASRIEAKPVLATHASCAQDSRNTFWAIGFNLSGKIVWKTELPGRGHGIAPQPNGSLLAVFARRPGRFILIIDSQTGKVLQKIRSESNRHFYGHGTFSSDGKTLFATENDFNTERGVVGRYDVNNAFKRLDEWDSGGIGPHEIIRTRIGETLIVANGGIATHPDYPRMKLNLHEMKPSICVIDASTGDIQQKNMLSPERHQLSLRHLCETADGSIWVGGQYEGQLGKAGALLYRFKPGRALNAVSGPQQNVFASMNGYIGSVASSLEGDVVGVSAPRGNGATFWNASNGELRAIVRGIDLSGISPADAGFAVSDGQGQILYQGRVTAFPLQWDNHLISLI